MKCLVRICAVLLIVAAAAAVYLWQGGFDISARVPHWDATFEAIETVRDWSITAHSRDVNIPPLNDPALVAAGVSEYHEMCRLCHGAPGVPAESFAQGLYPGPADLLSGSVQQEWNDNQLYWIVENGLKMTGMPSFGVTHDRETLIKIVAFMKKLPGMTPEQYKTLVGASEGQTEEHHH
jgi:hypothetical protein